MLVKVQVQPGIYIDADLGGVDLARVRKQPNEAWYVQVDKEDAKKYDQELKCANYYHDRGDDYPFQVSVRIRSNMIFMPDSILDNTKLRIRFTC